MEIDNRELTQEFLGWTAFGFTLYFYYKPAISFYNMIKGKISLDDTPAPLVTLTYISCLCWYIYSDLLISTQIHVITLIGIISNGALILIYLFYEAKKFLSDAILNALIISSGSYLIYLVLSVMLEDDENIGKITVGASCLLSIFQMITIHKILKERSLSSIPIFNAWLTLITCTLWGIYGFMISEFFVIVPQIVFGIFSSIQIFIYAHYKNNKYLINMESGYSPTVNIDNKKENSNDNQIEDLNNEKDSIIKEKEVKIV